MPRREPLPDQSDTQAGEVWIDPDTGLGWTITEADGDFITLEATVTQERMEHVNRLRKLYRYDPPDRGF